MKPVSTSAAFNPQPPGAPGDILLRSAESVAETAGSAAATAKDLTGAVKEVIENISDATKDATQNAAGKAKAIYQSAAEKAGSTLVTSREYVRRNPVPVVLGSVAFGACVGCLLMMALRKPTFGQRYADEPLTAVREALLGALAPVTQRVHKGYDSALNGAGTVVDRVRGLRPDRAGASMADRLAHLGSNLKFW